MEWAELFNDVIGVALDDILRIASQTPVEDIPDDEFVASETIGEVIDKLLILNIRIWYLEDQKAEARTDAELGAAQRKLQSCFRVKRPRLVAALNRMLYEAVVRGRLELVKDEYVKTYKAGDEDD